MASAVDCGVGTLRDVTGLCDWCGDECHPSQEICVALSCHRCENKLYHQSCVEKYLKKMGLASNRKTGFPCPFGKGKGSNEECKGKVEKSHPIVPKNEDKKKARMAPQVLEAMAKQPKAPKPAPAAKTAQAKPPRMPRKLAPPKPHQLPSASVWGQNGAAPVLANAHLPAPDPEPAAAQPRPAELPMGLVLEEAMSKAQKKNLARKKKRAAAGQETLSEASSDHQDNVAALGAGAAAAGMAPAAASNGAAGAALVGFDGTSFSAQNTMLEEQGHRFITDAAKYAALLGLYVGDSDDEGDDGVEHEEDYTGSGDGRGYGDQFAADGVGTAYESAACHNNLSAFSPDITPAAVVSPAPLVPIAPVVAPQPAVAKDVAGQEAAFDAAIAASIQQYQLEEEMRRQREVLASGFGGAFGGAAVNKAPPAPYAYSGVGTTSVPFQAPVAAPVVAPLAVPVAAPVTAPLPAPSGPSVLYNQTKQQPDMPAANYGNSGWVFGGGNQGQVLPPHMPAAYAPAGPAYGQAAQFAAMAAGHSAPEVAADDDDDDLSTLLALCGVAG